MNPEGRGSSLRTASAGIIKAGIALGLMAAFFICFFLAPGLTAAAALLLVLLYEMVKRL